MNKILNSALLILMLALPAMATTTTQVAGGGSTTVNGGLQVTLLNPQAIYTNRQSFVFNPLFNGVFGYGSNGVGVANANQFWATQYKITNGALVGTNVLNLNTMAFSNAPTGITAPSDAVGNPFSLQNLKCVVIQNLGVIGAPSETNALIVENPAGAIAFTNAFGLPFMEFMLEGPPTNAVSSNTPCFFKYSLGDQGWQVGTTLTNSILFTNPVLGSVITVNAYFLGSTNQ